MADRPQNFDMIRWDGSTDAEAWISERWPDDSGFGGPENERVLIMFNSWEIPPGSFIIDRQGGFHHLAPTDVNHFYQLAKSTNIPTEATA